MVETSVWPEIESLYRSEFTQFVGVARAITGDRDAGLEAVQEGFGDAPRNAGQWQGRGPLSAWVWRCVVNRDRLVSGPIPVEEAGGRARRANSRAPRR